MSYPEDTDPADIDAIETLPDEDDSPNTGLRDPGVDRHDFSTEWESLLEDAHEDPRGTLPEQAGLIRRMLERHGYVLDDDDPIAAGDEREIVATFAAASETAEAVRVGHSVDAGDVAQAIADLREIYESVVDRIEGRAR